MSQHDRILEMLENAGERGVHSFEFYEQRMPRGAAVICELRKEGHLIESRPERYKGQAQGVRYILRSESLFAMPETKPARPTPHYRSEVAA